MMYKRDRRNAARQRRSALVERIRLREEWSELKGFPDAPAPRHGHAHFPDAPAPRHGHAHFPNKKVSNTLTKPKASAGTAPPAGEALRGVVALVSVRAEPRAVALRAALAALGASVAPTWSPLVTHLVWAEGGCRATRARARALAARLVCPRWVRACAAARRRLPERSFPAAARASDLPSPRALRRLLKRAEQNLPVPTLLTENATDESAESPDATPDATDESAESPDATPDATDESAESPDATPDATDKSAESADATSDATDESAESPDATDEPHDAADAEARRGPRPRPPAAPPTLKRKLFNPNRVIDEGPCSDSEDAAPAPLLPESSTPGWTRRKRTRGVLAGKQLISKATVSDARAPASELAPRIVLSGMVSAEYAACCEIRTLGCCIQRVVTNTTTHVVLGETCLVHEVEGITPPRRAAKPRTLNTLRGAVRGCRVVRARWVRDCLEARKVLDTRGYEVDYLKKTAEMARDERQMYESSQPDYGLQIFGLRRIRLSTKIEDEKSVQELLSLCGATVLVPARGATAPVPARGQPVPRLRRGYLKLTLPKNWNESTQKPKQKRNYSLSMQAKTESVKRQANEAENEDSEDDFDLRTPQERRHKRKASSKPGRKKTKQTCSRDYVEMTPEEDAVYDFTIGTEPGQVSSKWVFDSVEAAHERPVTRYVNK